MLVGVVALVVLVGLLFGVFDIFEAACLDVDLEVPAFVVAERHPVEAHLPAMEVSVDVERGVGKAFVDEVVACGNDYLPIGGEVDVAGDTEGLNHLFFEVKLRCDVGADIAEGVIKRDVPRHGKVGIRAHHQGGVVIEWGLQYGWDNLLASGFSAGFVAFACPKG